MLTAFADGTVFGETYGSGPVRVVALHGWGRTRKDFAALLSGLDVAGVAVDLPGFGASPPPPEPWGAHEYADALEPVLDHVRTGDERLVLLGHSRGGCVAVVLAARRPDAVDGVVCTGAPLVRRSGPSRRAPLRYRLGRTLHRWRLVSDARMEALRQRYGSADYRAAQGVQRSTLVRMVNESYEDELGQLTVPLELVWGADDTDVPVEIAERAAELAPRARLTVLEGVGHDTVRHAVADLHAAVVRLLSPTP